MQVGGPVFVLHMRWVLVHAHHIGASCGSFSRHQWVDADLSSSPISFSLPSISALHFLPSRCLPLMFLISTWDVLGPQTDNLLFQRFV